VVNSESDNLGLFDRGHITMQKNCPEVSQLSDVDFSYYLLKQSGQPKYYKDLIIDVLTTKRNLSMSEVQGGLISGVYTQITMDSRFVHLGKGVWGLVEWYPQRGVPRFVEIPAEVIVTPTVRRDKMLLAEIQDVFASNDLPDDFEEKFDETD
jgi:DNA-directed RNA polymerase subunit delta